MKRLQIRIDEELDRSLQMLAQREGTSRSALVRRYVRERLGVLPPLDTDPIAQMIGVDDFEAADPNSIVYG